MSTKQRLRKKLQQKREKESGIKTAKEIEKFIKKNDMINSWKHYLKHRLGDDWENSIKNIEKNKNKDELGKEAFNDLLILQEKFKQEYQMAQNREMMRKEREEFEEASLANMRINAKLLMKKQKEEKEEKRKSKKREYQKRKRRRKAAQKTIKKYWDKYGKSLIQKTKERQHREKYGRTALPPSKEPWTGSYNLRHPTPSERMLLEHYGLPSNLVRSNKCKNIKRTKSLGGKKTKRKKKRKRHKKKNKKRTRKK